MDTTTIVMVLGVASAGTMFASLVRQTMRAESLSAALAKIEATLAECEEAVR